MILHEQRKARLIQPGTEEYSQLEIHSITDLIRLWDTDALTGLPDKSWAENKLPGMLTAYDGNSALLMLDLDGFKEINDSEGHLAGDEHLKKVASGLRLRNDNAPEHQSGPLDIIFRNGGDEFGLFLPGVSTQEDLDMIVIRIQEILDSLGVSASIDGALHKSGEDAKSLISRADKAVQDTKDMKKAIRVTEHLKPTELEELLGDIARVEEKLASVGQTWRDVPGIMRGLLKMQKQ